MRLAMNTGGPDPKPTAFAIATRAATRAIAEARTAGWALPPLYDISVPTTRVVMGEDGTVREEAPQDDRFIYWFVYEQVRFQIRRFNNYGQQEPS